MDNNLEQAYKNFEEAGKELAGALQTVPIANVLQHEAVTNKIFGINGYLHLRKMGKLDQIVFVRTMLTCGLVEAKDIVERYFNA